MVFVRYIALAFGLLDVLFAGQAQNPAGTNYDEAKVPSYTLPDLLKTTRNVPVQTKATWEMVRRPEVINLFEENVYGQMPKAYDRFTSSIKHENARAMAGKAILKEVLIDVVKNNKSVHINLVLFIPTKPKKPVPVFLLINNRGKENMDPSRMQKSDFWSAEMGIDSGYAMAAFHVSDLAPDDTATYVNGVLQLYPEQLTAPDGMRAIGAWAWGASRVLDYFEKEAAIDSKKVIVVGHSRGGKASLWAAAQDQRFALCVTNCSGNTGAALSRRQFGERIHQINAVFSHWFAKNYKKFNHKEEELPVDQHMLLASIAPRPLYVTNASLDLWADPKGTYLALQQAEKVYALYGIKSTLPATMPAINQPVSTSRVGYHLREGNHDMTAYDWAHFIKFATKMFKK